MQVPSLSTASTNKVALFSRREIQARIDELAPSITKEQLASLLTRLNGTGRAVLDAIWELFWLTALGRHGAVQYERKFPGGTRFADIHFSDAGLEFIADIVAPSDLGYEEDNPIDVLDDELRRRYAKHRVIGGFALHVDSRTEGEMGDQKVKLLLPTAAEIPQFVKENFEAFIRGVAAAPEQAAIRHAVVRTGGTIRIDYSPRRRPYNHGAGHLSFDVPYSLTRNPIFNALKAKKRQLAASGFQGLKGVIMCDGDCSVLATRMYSHSAFTVDQIVQEFFRQNSAVAFVLTLGIATHHNSLGLPRTTFSYIPKLYFQTTVPADVRTSLLNVLDLGLKEFPLPLRTPVNVRHLLAEGSPPPVNRTDYFGWLSYSTGSLMQPIEIKISARTLTALLGGEISLEEFQKEHRTKGSPSHPPIEPLKRALDEGRKLEALRLQPLPGEDDDEVVLTFGGFDPAKIRFRAPG